jgi:hypothetical protein
LRACRPKTSFLQERMSAHVIASRADVSDAAKGLTLDQLLDVVPCSRAELEASLRDLEAVAVPAAADSGGARYALLDGQYQMSILKVRQNLNNHVVLPN